MNEYQVHIDNAGGYIKDLFFIEVPVNERILTEISVLVRQYTLSVGYYNFWDELKKQTHRGSIFDVPPYNLHSNFISPQQPDKKVSGYFGVTHEQATRWYFNREDLSYYAEDYQKRICTTCGLDPGPECFGGVGYQNGRIISQPEWWGR